MIKKIYIFIILFFLGLTTQSQAYECDFDKLKPGVTKKALEEINIFAYGPDTSDIFTKHLFVEEICNGDTEGLHNINVMLVFYKDKLIKVNYIHQIPETPTLFQIAKNDYKINFERNKASIEKKQSEFYSTTVNDNSYFYVLLKEGNWQEEYLEIVSDKNIRKYEEFLLKIEEAR
jgi:hypothetical protein